VERRVSLIAYREKRFCSGRGDWVGVRFNGHVYSQPGEFSPCQFAGFYRRAVDGNVGPLSPEIAGERDIEVGYDPSGGGMSLLPLFARMVMPGPALSP
jgi:hypothetical protein